MVMKIMYVASDNRLSSGAFKSMVKLCEIERDMYNVEPIVVIPTHGDGEELLKIANLKYIYVRSEDWIISNSYESFKGFIKKRIKLALNFLAIIKLQKLMKKNEIDIVHINTSYTYVGAVAANKLNIPVVWHLRELLEEDQNNRFLVKDGSKKLIYKSSKIIAISNYVYNKYKQSFLEKIIEIPNGIDESLYYSLRDILLEDITRFIYVGGISEKKGFGYIIEAMKQLIEEGIDNVHLEVLGNDKEPYGEKMKQIIQENKLSDYITFRGVCVNTHEFYKKSDVMLMTSECEAFGRTTVEAMQSGCLVIGSDSGATPDILNHGKAGILFKPRDSVDLKNKMIYVMKNKSICRKIAKDGQNRAIRKYTARENAKQIYEVYKSILHE